MSATPEFFTLQEAVAGRYSIVRELGRGGMGIVFLARDVALDRPVAIKMLPPELAASRPHRDRFAREARTAARLSHPHIVPIHAVEEHPAAVFFVMAFVDGETLAARVARQGPLSAGDAMRVVQEVAWALGHAHASGVVHRDVKPDNILLEYGTGRAVVTDFGIARAADSPDTSAEGRIVGTPRYMSPEQAAGDAVDAPSDIYSLGAVAYFAVSGRPPYDGESASAIMAKHVTAPPPVVERAAPGLPPVFAAVIDRCLAKDVGARFSAADEIASTLRTAGHASEIAVPVRRFLRDTEGAGSEILTAATVASVGLIGFVYQYFKPSSGLFDGMIESILYLGVAAAMGSLALVRGARFLSSARDLIRAGYGHSAVRPALLLEQEARAQERPTAWPRRLSHAAFLGGSIFSVWLFKTDTFIPALVGFAGIIALPTIYVHRLTHAAYGATNWLSRLVKGRVGKWLFRLAGVGLDRQPRATPAVGEPTAVAIGQAAHDLFAELPESVRCQLPELPALIARLEAEALAVRERTPAPGADGGFVTAVAALETLRLDLLRLHASGNLDDLTRHLDAAKHIGREISVELRARADAQRLLERSLG